MEDNLLVSVYPGEHFVQFYPNEQILIKNIRSFIGGGIVSGDPCVVIATREHLSMLEEKLTQYGLNLEPSKDKGQLFMLDASQTLESFMVDGMPDRKLFKNTVGEVLRQLSSKGQTIRAFGEMVALLAEQGNYQAVVALEKLWGDMANYYDFTLYCAYPDTYSDPLKHQTAIENLEQICSLHDRAFVPARSAFTPFLRSDIS